MDDSKRHWSREVTEEARHDVGGGAFAGGSAAEIAKAVVAAARDEGPDDTLERRAVAKLTFFENRAGRNLSDERRAVIEKAKQLVRAELVKGGDRGSVFT